MHSACSSLLLYFFALSRRLRLTCINSWLWKVKFVQVTIGYYKATNRAGLNFVLVRPPPATLLLG
jgi:hypothetical protein